MMKKTIITTSLILSGLLILDSFNTGHALTLLLLAGIVPGTNIVLSPEFMMEVCALGLGVMFSRLTTPVVSQYLAARYSQPKAAVPAK